MSDQERLGEPAWEDEPVAALRRWEDSGAVWRVQHRAPEVVTIGLFTCDGAEEMSVFRCASRAVADFLAGRESNDGLGSVDGSADPHP